MLTQPTRLHAALLATEPIMILVTLYMSFLYGLLFLFFEGFPISFVEQRGWKPQIGSLSFLSLFVGILLGLTGMVTWSSTRRLERWCQSGVCRR
jgi:hypothetical protein